ncbi:hypothetical protein EHS25_002297 [Saitozyma podzolica]|uniref:Alpha-glucuronidase n=1 Tax=Saitozyma podzolica TaxID=1890683 RepID=A0A427YDF4_9TREE|nr:hypothetical protein EHS25_002297 [Saitozyma podzolica]
MPSSAIGFDGWLRYDPLPEPIRRAFPLSLSHIVVLDHSPTSPVHVAGQELQHGFEKLMGTRLALRSHLENRHFADSIVVGTTEAFAAAGGDTSRIPHLDEDGFYIDSHFKEGRVLVLGRNPRGALYGAFEYLFTLAQGDVSRVACSSNPCSPIRFVNEWDNLDGSIERGYAGRSIFWKDGHLRDDEGTDERIKQFARLLASIRINGCVVNNVNAGPTILTPENMRGLRHIANLMRPYGVRIGICVNFDSPSVLGGLATSDPCDSLVIKWWNEITSELYVHVPDLLGFTSKGDSEGQPGPMKYGRTLAEGANLFARALQPHGDGLIMFRAFVYDPTVDPTDPKADRCKAAVDWFKPLDGHFDDNVVVQIKWGPIDFQVREPTSPLFANLKNTNMAIEFQHCQEYMGQQTHTVYMAPLFKGVLDFDFRDNGNGDGDGKPTPTRLRDILSSSTPDRRRLHGFTTVLNVGDDSTWMGHLLAMANFYSFGRQAWDPALDPRLIAEEWVRLTFGLHPKVLQTVTDLLMGSWSAFEGYSGPMGLQSLFDVETHYGANPAQADTHGGGHWIRADATSIGNDRTSAITGTGFSAQYPPLVTKMFDSVKTCPEELLLWFHHLPYTHRLKNGKTIIQHLYDEHYRGAAVIRRWVTQWAALKGLIDDARHDYVAFRLEYQAGHAIVWRDVINTFFNDKCHIEDERGRVGNHPWRIEAEDMELDGYESVEMHPKELASGGKYVAAKSLVGGSIKKLLDVESGSYDIAINYFDHLGGNSKYEVFLNHTSIGKWSADLSDIFLHDKCRSVDSDSAARVTFRHVQVGRGDVLKIYGAPDGEEMAALDYISVLPLGEWD